MTSRASKASKPLMIASTSFVLIWIFVAAFPFVWTLWGSFKVQGDFFSKADWRYALKGTRTAIETGGLFTGAGYEGAWVQQEFWRAALNTMIVVVFTVLISLTLGTLGGYALARSGHNYAFWLLMIALVFRAMPHITLVSGYLLPFFEWNLWGHLPTTIIVPMIFVLCVVGTYALSSRLFDVWTMLFFGVLGYVLRQYKFPVAPLVLGIVLGDLMEKSLRRGLVLSDGDLTPFFTRPIAGSIFAIIAIVLLMRAPFMQKLFKRKTP